MAILRTAHPFRRLFFPILRPEVSRRILLSQQVIMLTVITVVTIAIKNTFHIFVRDMKQNHMRFSEKVEKKHDSDLDVRIFYL